jgi:hypothetical protein
VTRAEQVRRIYVELRRTVSADVSSRDLLRLAAFVVASNAPIIEFDDEPERQDDRSLLHQPLDVAFSDGGWKVMYFEIRQHMVTHDEHEPFRGNSAVMLAAIKRYKGYNL